MDRPKWQVIYDIIYHYNVDDVLTYEEILTALNSEHIDFCRAEVYRAIRELEVDKKRTMECVRGIGYRVVAAKEHMRLVRRDLSSIRKKSRRAHSKTVNVRRDELTAEERRTFDAMEDKLNAHSDLLERITGRAERFAEDLIAAREEHRNSHFSRSNLFRPIR